ncbi:unnamed protein product [Absidia cylindrospora]
MSSSNGIAKKKISKPTSNQKSVLYGRRIDGVYVRLACPVCHRESFSTQLGLLNHCRISHSLEFGFYENIMAQCGTPVDESEVPLDHPIRNRPLTLPVVPVTTPKTLERPTIKEYEEDVDLELDHEGSTAKRKKISPELVPTPSDQKQDALTSSPSTGFLETTASDTSTTIHDSSATTTSTMMDIPSRSYIFTESPAILDNTYVAHNTALEDKLMSLSKEPTDLDSPTTTPRINKKTTTTSSSSAASVSGSPPPSPSPSSLPTSAIDSPVTATPPPPALSEKEISASVPLTPVSEIPNDTKTESLTSAIAEKGSRFYIKRRIVVGNVSKFIAPEKRDSTLKNYTHKWMIYVVEPPQDQDKTPFLTGVRYHLHPSYKPYDVVDVTEPPFRLTRLGWGEFPIRLQLYFVDKRRNKSLDVIHHLKLDYTLSGRQMLGNERGFDIELDRNTNFQDLTTIPTTMEISDISSSSSPSPLSSQQPQQLHQHHHQHQNQQHQQSQQPQPQYLHQHQQQLEHQQNQQQQQQEQQQQQHEQQQHQQKSSTVPISTAATFPLNTSSIDGTPATTTYPINAPLQQPSIHTSSQRLILLQGILKECVLQYPIVMRAVSQLHQSVSFPTLPYTCARNNQHFMTLPSYKRKALEWHRAHLLRILVQQRCQETNDVILNVAGDGLGTKEVVKWCRVQGYTPVSFPSSNKNNAPTLSPELISEAEKQQEEEPQDWCRYCGLETHVTMECTNKPKSWRKRMVLGEQHTLTNAQSLLTSLGLNLQQEQQQQKKPHHLASNTSYDTMNTVAIDDDDDDDLEVEVDLQHSRTFSNKNTATNTTTPPPFIETMPTTAITSSPTTMMTATTETDEALLHLIRQVGLDGNVDDRALDWVWSVIAQLRLKHMIGHDITVARNGQLQFQRPIEPEMNCDTAMEQRLIVGNLFVQLTKVFLKKMLKGGVAMWQKEKDQDSDKSSKLLVPYHIHQAVRQMPSMDFLTNAYMGTFKDAQKCPKSTLE